MKKMSWTALCCVVLIAITLVNILSTLGNSPASSEAFVLGVTFSGQYQIGDGPWLPIVPGAHISACSGNVRLRGQLYKHFPGEDWSEPVLQNEAVSMCFNHINASAFLNGQRVYVFDGENPQLGDAACGKFQCVYTYPAAETDQFEMLLSNPHTYGNDRAVDEFLGSMHMYVGDYYEMTLSRQDRFMQIAGYLIFSVGLILVGLSLFSTFGELKIQDYLWPAGLATICAGGFLLFDIEKSYLVYSNMKLVTNVHLLCLMLYAFFTQLLVSLAVDERVKKVGTWTVTVLALVMGWLLIFSALPQVKLYDMLPLWAMVQAAATLLLTVCSFVKIRSGKLEARILRMALIPAQLALLADLFAAWKGLWPDGLCTMFVGFALFIAFMMVVLWWLPKAIRASIREKEMQVELERNKTALMLSQIQPHFLYNSLGAIRELCRQDPEEARDALSFFIKYLRGNLDALQKEQIVPFSKELEHIQVYLQLESMRFGEDLKIVYDIQASDFTVPSLTVQPLVENAVRHGICSREDGGTVTLRTVRNGKQVIITVSDDGMGFDTTKPIGKDHVGLENVRSRLQHLAGADLTLTSTLGRGTTVTITLNTENR